MLALTIPTGSPTHWYAAGFPPLRSARLFPNTPDRDLAEELRKQLGKNVLDPLRYEQDVWMPQQADRLTRLLGGPYGTPAAPVVKVPEWDHLVATAVTRFEPGETLGVSLKAARDRLKQFKPGSALTCTFDFAENAEPAGLKYGAKLTVRGVAQGRAGLWVSLVGCTVAPPGAEKEKPPPEVTRVSADELEKDPAKFTGKMIEVSGRVNRVEHAGPTRATIELVTADGWRVTWAEAVAAHEELKLDDATLARGAVVYRRWCMQCHGPNGSGEVTHAVEAGPMPRDFRQGQFKYVTAFPPPGLPKKGLGPNGKARRSDLAYTVRKGIDGTIMPSFATLPEQDVQDVVSYVIHLSVRGETEFGSMAKMIKPSDNDPLFTGGEIDWLVMMNGLEVLSNWGVASKAVIPVPADPSTNESERLKSAVRGFKLYNSPEFGCNSCHSNYGRAQQLKWDAWGTIVQPRNLTLGVYRGGRRGEDLYARLYGGIYPSGMTAFHDKVTTAPSGTPDKLWDITHFLQALGDPADRKRMQQLDSEVKFDQ
jgi:mono/diheme cytochrome c family protein